MATLGRLVWVLRQHLRDQLLMERTVILVIEAHWACPLFCVSSKKRHHWWNVAPDHRPGSVCGGGHWAAAAASLA
ncbi:hypothetical protein SS05631_a45710 (plasmid) [Sinorhizobium sp. CCBAU 05631]|nr:hypothetical protein SS05631_a45710 [Sinorhizobium sp. CCBAU 05631]